MAYTYQPYPTVSVGSSLQLVETILKEDNLDFVALGRALVTLMNLAIRC